MGFGYGAAIGAQIGNPDKRVIHFTGDGSFHMNLNEAATAVSQELPIITVIMNNRVLGMVYQWQTIFYGGRYSATTPERKTNFPKVIEAFGVLHEPRVSITAAALRARAIEKNFFITAKSMSDSY